MSPLRARTPRPIGFRRPPSAVRVPLDLIAAAFAGAIAAVCLEIVPRLHLALEFFQ